MSAVLIGLQIPSAWAGSLMAAPTLTAPQGSTIMISGNVSSSSDCPAGAAVQLTSTPTMGTTNLFPNGMGPQVPRDANGDFHATVLIPPSTPVGSYTIGVRCGPTTAAITEVLNVTAGTKPSISVSQVSAPPGGTVTISGVVPTNGAVFCASGNPVQLTSTAPLFPPDGTGPTVARDTAGNFHTTFTVPAATAPGTYTIGIRCGGGSLVVVATLQVTAPAATTTTAPTTTTTTTTITTTTTTPSSTSTSVAPATTAPATTTTTVAVPGKSSAKKSPVRWVALGLLALVVVAAVVVILTHRAKR